MRKETLSFGITNTTNGTIPVSLFGNNADTMDNANATTRYRWDVTGFTITNENNIAIENRNVGVSNLSIARTTFSGTSLQNVINALNGLNLGVFFITTETVSTNSIVNTSFVYGSGFNNQVKAIAIQSDGKILVGGQFTTYQGTGANRIVRLNADGSIDGTFVYGSGFNSSVNSIAIQSDGKILVGGNFTSYNGTGANYIIRLNSDGSIDGTFVYGSGFGFIVNSISIQTNGKILCVGDFTTYNGTGANRIVRLNSDGSIDGTFVYGSGFNISLNLTKIQSDGKILVGGNFTSYNGTGANRIIRLNSDGSIDTSWGYGSGFSSTVLSIAIQNNGNILCGGSFTTFNTTTSANRIIGLLQSSPTTTSTFINNYNNIFAFGTLQILNTSQTATLSYSMNLNL